MVVPNVALESADTHCHDDLRYTTRAMSVTCPGGAGGRRGSREGRGEHPGGLRTPPVHRVLSGSVADAQTTLRP